MGKENPPVALRDLCVLAWANWKCRRAERLDRRDLHGDALLKELREFLAR